MSRGKARKHKSRNPPAGRGKHRSGGKRSRFRRWWPVAAVLLAGAAIVAFWLPRHRSPAPLPVLDLSQVDARVAETIQEHLQEVRAHPDSGAAWGWLGGLLRVYSFPTEARQCLVQAERLDPQNPRWPYFQSLLLMATSPAEAVLKARRAAQLCGNDPEMPRFHLARLLAEQGDWPAAKRELQQLADAQPEFTPALLLLAHEAQHRGSYDEAIQWAARCTNDLRTARTAWSLLAVLYQRTQNSDAASQAATSASKMPLPPSLFDPFEAEVAWRRGDARNTSMVCHELLAAGQLDQAAPLIESLVRDHPSFPDTWLLLGRLQILRKDFAGAEQALRHHLQIEPQNTQGLFQLGTALLNQDRFAEAADTFAKATALKPDFGPAYFNRGLALARSGALQEAARSFSESLRFNPDHRETYFLLAELHGRLGQKQEALQLLERVALLSPDESRLGQLRDWVRTLPEPP